MKLGEPGKQAQDNENRDNINTQGNSRLLKRRREDIKRKLTERESDTITQAVEINSSESRLGSENNMGGKRNKKGRRTINRV